MRALGLHNICVVLRELDSAVTSRSETCNGDGEFISGDIEEDGCSAAASGKVCARKPECWMISFF